MRRRKKQEEEENLERWLVSYADFITLLFAFFVVMYSISSVNEGKYRVLSDTLVQAFKNPPRSIQPIKAGDEVAVGEPSALSKKKGSPSASGALDTMAREFEFALKNLIDQNLINVDRSKSWVEIEINNSILYPSGSAQLSESAVPVLDKLAEILNRYPNPLQVEGFTDNVPIKNERFPSNWELSAARAASVVRLFQRDGVEPGRMAAIGYGEYRPVAPNATPEGRTRNRRVAIVVLADEKARRALDMRRSRQDGGAAQEAGS